MKLHIGYSPCPNDTFIFDALVHQKIDTKGIEFIPELHDVEVLNKLALKGNLDVTKISFHAYAYCSEKYILSNSGSALGKSCGPLLIAKRSLNDDEVNISRIAIPGFLTTANLLFSIEFPEAKDKHAVVFNRIEDKVINGEYDAGVIIHENRFTYASKGLVKICDLGEKWEVSSRLPIPLGGIAIKRDLPLSVRKTVEELIRESIEYAYQHPSSPRQYMSEHASEMDPLVLEKHVGLYVNEYSMDLGDEGRRAVENMFSRGVNLKLFSDLEKPYFV